jgi:AcrR family transcriptional regulator
MTAGHTVFLRDGYAGATIDTVAAEAGVSKQTIYNHLKDKEGLFLAVVEDALRRSNDLALSAIAEFPEHPTDLGTELIGLCWQMADSFLDEQGRAMRRLLFAEAPGRPALLPVWRRWGPTAVVTALSERFARLDRAGHLEVDDPDQAARQLFAMVIFDPVIHSDLGLRRQPYPELDRGITAAVRVFLRSYAPR